MKKQKEVILVLAIVTIFITAGLFFTWPDWSRGSGTIQPTGFNHAYVG